MLIGKTKKAHTTSNKMERANSNMNKFQAESKLMWLKLIFGKILGFYKKKS